MKKIENTAYRNASEQYEALGVNTEDALNALEQFSLSLHCWQGDDVGGFENRGMGLDGGLAATGNYPGKARNPEELRADLDQALALIPGRHRLNLHSIYADTSETVERNALEPRHFQGWIDWARERGMGLDFNPTLFSHPNASDGFTLAHPDGGIREFWIEHCLACRTIAAAMGKALGTPSVHNIWIPDGFKDLPFDRLAPRQRLRDALDTILSDRSGAPHVLDSVESKLFGIGAESYTVGSYDFYLAYAVANRTLLCLDSGHFHPTEVISDKISSVLLFLDEILLHVSRPVRWDSDHVVILDDELRAIAQAIVRGGFRERIHIGLDFFDASINRVAAWVIGARAMMKALLLALLEPADALETLEGAGDYTGRLAMLETAKTLPFGEIWEAFCARNNVPSETEWLAEVQRYEREVLAGRQG